MVRILLTHEFLSINNLWGGTLDRFGLHATHMIYSALEIWSQQISVCQQPFLGIYFTLYFTKRI